MYQTTLHRLLCVAMLFVLSWPTSVLANAVVSVIPSGGSSYTVLGSVMDGVAGIQIDIAYDAASLVAPTVRQGGLAAGTMFAANTSRAGFIKIAIISTQALSGNGEIAKISFASKTGSGGITSITSTMIDSKGSPLASSTGSTAAEAASPVLITTPGVPFSQTSQAVQSTLASHPVATAIPTFLGSVTQSPEPLQQTDTKPAIPPTVPEYSGEPAVARIAEQTQTRPSGKKPDTDAKAVETLQYVVYRGVLDQFKQYKGNKNLSAMTALFDKKVAQNIHQEPAILLNNGKNKATITVEIPARIIASPNIAVNGGTLLSFKRVKQNEGRWTAEVLPEAGAVRVAVMIIVGAEEFEYPLTVVPQVKTALPFGEQGWNRFLKEVGTAKAPLHDLNNDGVRDYLDEYIFVARYLSNKAAPVK